MTQDIQENIEKIRKACIAANPEIMEPIDTEDWWVQELEITHILKDVLGAGYQNMFNKNLNYDQWLGIRDHLANCAEEVHKVYLEKLSLNKEAIGRPIRLADVLMAVEANRRMTKWYAVNTHGLFLKNKVEEITARPYAHPMISSLYSWNLRDDDLTHQSPETLAFLAKLLP